MDVKLKPKSAKKEKKNGLIHSETEKFGNQKITNGSMEEEDVFDSKKVLSVLTSIKNGDFSARMPIDSIGINGKICDTLNDIISLNERMMLEFTKAGNIIGKQGKLTLRIEVPY